MRIRTRVLVGSLTLLAFAGFVWPTLWTHEIGSDGRTPVRENRITGTRWFLRDGKWVRSLTRDDLRETDS